VRWARCIGLAALVLGAASCFDYDTKESAHGARDSATPAPDTAVETSAPDAPDAIDDSVEDGGDTAEVAPAPVTFDQVHAFFVVKCVPCHEGPVAATSDGGHNMANPDVAVAYAASQLPSSFAGKTKGALALQYVRGGIMPLGAGCTGKPASDAGNDACLTADELDLLQRWVDGGQLAPEP